MYAMIPAVIVVGLALAVANARGDGPQPGAQVAQSVEVPGEGDSKVTVRYLLFVPKNYDEQKAWPLMLFLHGAGERGEDLELVKKWGPPLLVPDKQDFPFVLVSPQCPKDRFWNVDELARLVEHIAGTLKIDKSRMYATGLSMGGYGSWGLLAKYPKLFAAAVPVCGGGDPESAEKMKDIPIWAFHGDKDDVVPLEQTTRMIDAIIKAGGKPKLTVYPGVGHNSWSATYDDPEVYKWLLSHKRQE